MGVELLDVVSQLWGLTGEGRTPTGEWLYKAKRRGTDLPGNRGGGGAFTQPRRRLSAVCGSGAASLRRLGRVGPLHQLDWLCSLRNLLRSVQPGMLFPLRWSNGLLFDFRGLDAPLRRRVGSDPVGG